jgi:pilus assembly protein Flp/PilA
MFRSETGALIGRFVHEESGATAIEYALVAAGIGVAVASTVFALGSHIKTALYDEIGSAF